MSPRYLTVTEVAEILRLTPAGVRMRIRRGRIKARNVGTPHKHEWRIPASEVDAA